MMSFEHYLAKFLRSITEMESWRWRTHGLTLLTEHCENYENKEKFIEAMVYLLASNTSTLFEIQVWMKNNGYDFGEYDENE